jgi:hypothetical protein
MAAALALPVAAQDEGGGGGGGRGGGGGFGGGGGSGLPTGIDAPRTIPQQFASKLKLDTEQRAVVDRLLAAGQTEAAPHVQEMLQARQRMLNASRANNAAELKTAQDACTAAAAKIAGTEASTFAKVYAQLKPNQQKEATEAFALMAGLFSNPPAAGGGMRGGGMRGPGGGR